jgi:hypothetical protein
MDMEDWGVHTANNNYAAHTHFHNGKDEDGVETQIKVPAYCVS